MERLVRSGHARLDEIAAVTFTENAATTLKLRLRERLERARADSHPRRRREEPLLRRPRDARAGPGLDHPRALRGDPPGASPRVRGGAGLSYRGRGRGRPRLLGGLGGVAARAPGRGRRGVAGGPRPGHPPRGVRPLGRAHRAAGPGPHSRGRARPQAPGGAAPPPMRRRFRSELLAQAARAQELVAGLPDADVLVAKLKGLAAFAERAARSRDALSHAHLGDIATIHKSLGFKPRWPSDESLQEAGASPPSPTTGRPAGRARGAPPCTRGWFWPSRTWCGSTKGRRPRAGCSTSSTSW